MTIFPPWGRGGRWPYLAIAAASFALGSLRCAPEPATPVKELAIDRSASGEKTATVEAIAARKTEAKAANVQRDVRYVKVFVKAKDGTETTTVTREDKTREHANDLIHVDFSKATQGERLVWKERETVKLVERARPQWSVAVLPGYDLGARQLQLGGAVERRIFGPVMAGVWGNTTGAAGLSVRLEF